MNKESASLLDAAISEIDYAITSNKSKEVKEHYLNNAKRYIGTAKQSMKVDGGTSDGYHTFDELYYHRMVLFSIICNQNKEESFKSKLHHDGTMYESYFIVGVATPKGQYTYHYHMDHWDMFDVIEMDYAPEWDGHKPEDITRLLSL
jgi:hypothetical protein